MTAKPKMFELKLKSRSAKKIRTLGELGRAFTTVGTAIIPLGVASYLTSSSMVLLSVLLATGAALIAIGSYCMGVSEDWTKDSKLAGSVLR